MAFITPPDVLPYSAETLLVKTENSCTASTPKSPPNTLPGAALLKSLILTPSSR